MKILISLDIEGASGIVSSREIGYPGQPVGDPQATPDYLTARRWLTADVNAAVEGALEAGATSFVLHDTHGLDYRNINLDELHQSVEVVKGQPVIFYEYEDLDSSYAGNFLIGMHARAGQPGVLSHILNWPLLEEVRINGEPVGESHVTAALAAHFSIPTVLITGDNVICEEIAAWNHGQMETAVVKTSLTRYAVRCLPLTVARQRIRDAAYRAVKRIGSVQPRGYEAPITLEVDTIDRQVARAVSWMPEIKWDGNRTVAYTGDNFLSVYKVLLAILWIMSSRMNP